MQCNVMYCNATHAFDELARAEHVGCGHRRGDGEQVGQARAYIARTHGACQAIVPLHNV